ncbi:MAG: hypothetical protein WCJ35_17160 [Planctomycetota bacterium]
MCHSCSGGELSRREFLGTAAAGGILLMGGLSAQPLRAAEEAGWPKLPPVKVHVVYLGKGGAWPKPEFNASAEVAGFQKYLAGVEERLGDVKFVGGQLITNSPAEAAKVAAKLGDADAVLLVHLSFGDASAFAEFIKTGKPVAIYSQPFSGHDWMYVAEWLRQGQRVILAASSDRGDIDRAVALLRVPVYMRRTKILLVGPANGTEAACNFQRVKEKLGVEVISIDVPTVVKVHAAIDPKEVEAEAESYWLSQAKKIVEPTRQEIVKSAGMYLAMKKLMIDHGARAITIKCLGGIPIDKLGYPCLGFSKLLDLGLVGACEADMDSTLTMLMFGYAFGVPGFITDPLFDTARNAVIHAHCLAPTKMNGPTDHRAPFVIRTHRDDNRGASLAVELKVGQPITCAKLVNLDSLLISTGKITEIPDFDDRGCRTQIITEVADARSMLRNWGGGVLSGDMMTLLHRVVFYGDRLNAARDLAQLMGIKVVMEG